MCQVPELSGIYICCIPNVYKRQTLHQDPTFRPLLHAHLTRSLLLPSSCLNNLQPATMSGRGKGKTAKKSVSQSSKAGLQFPVGRVAR
jgi:hypothetical protein